METDDSEHLLSTTCASGLYHSFFLERSANSASGGHMGRFEEKRSLNPIQADLSKQMVRQFEVNVIRL